MNVEAVAAVAGAVPKSSPVDALRLSHEGRAPDTTAQVYGAEPPEAEIICE